jgi:hypothetical protein
MLGHAQAKSQILEQELETVRQQEMDLRQELNIKATEENWRGETSLLQSSLVLRSTKKDLGLLLSTRLEPSVRTHKDPNYTVSILR